VKIGNQGVMINGCSPVETQHVGVYLEIPIYRGYVSRGVLFTDCFRITLFPAFSPAVLHFSFLMSPQMIHIPGHQEKQV